MKNALIIAYASSLLVACTSTRNLGRPASFDEINDFGRETPAHVWLQESPGQTRRGPFDAADLRVGVDSTSWLDEQTLLIRTVPTSSVVRVSFSDHGDGALQGAALGLLGGACIGAVVGASQGGNWLFSAGTQAMFGSIGFGALGALGGTIAGAIVGTHVAYDRDEPIVVARVARGTRRSP